MDGNRFLRRISKARLKRFCKKWSLGELSLFGSVLCEDFRADSDVDVLITFVEGAQWSLLDLVRMQEELEIIFHRPVDLLTRRGLEQSANRTRSERILNSAKPLITIPAHAIEVSHVSR